MGSKEKKSFILGSLILVLAISIGYFGISNVKDTYATSSDVCYFCTGSASNGKFYQWTTSPEGTCNGGSWTILSNVTSETNCKTTTYKCYFCTGQPDFKWSVGTPSDTCNGGTWQLRSGITEQSDCSYKCYYCTGKPDFKWSVGTPSDTCNGGIWTAVDKSLSECKVQTSCTYTDKSSCESANSGYNCVVNSNGCYVKGTAKTKCTYTTESSCESANIGYNCVKNGTDDYGNTCYKTDNNITYTIKFDANGGTGTTKEVKCTYGSNCTLTANTFTKDGYVFNGWNTKNDGTGVSYDDKAVVKNLSSTDGVTVTLYAKWKQKEIDVKTYKVTFKYNDKVTQDKVVEVDEDDTVSVIEPIRKNYVFGGWFTDEELNNKYDFTTKVKGDLTLYAKWTEDNSSGDKIDNSSNDKTDDEISSNSKTGDIMMFIAWTVGIGALAYTVYYYKTRKEN